LRWAPRATHSARDVQRPLRASRTGLSGQATLDIGTIPDFRQRTLGNINQETIGRWERTVMLEVSNILFSALLLTILSLAAVTGSAWVANLLYAL
jgi:hypothetical protein